MTHYLSIVSTYVIISIHTIRKHKTLGKGCRVFTAKQDRFYDNTSISVFNILSK